MLRCFSDAKGNDPFASLRFASLFELFQGAAKLVGAGGAFAAAVYAVEALYHVVYLLAGYEAAYSLQVAVAASQECYLLDDVVVIGHYVYQ